jgi:uncharacterized membrane protein
VVAVAVGIGLAFVAPWQLALLGAWDLAAGVLLIWTWWELVPLDADQSAAVAVREDTGRRLIWLLFLVLSTGTLVGVLALVIKAEETSGGPKAAMIAVASFAVLESWALVHTTFAQRYARLYYQEPPGGIDFSSAEPPDYTDFAYVAFTVGMTYQVSDTDITNRTLRHTVLAHSLLSFLFGTAIIALTINILAGLVH